MKYFEIFLLELVATNFSPSSGFYANSQVSARGAIQGHHGPLVMIKSTIVVIFSKACTASLYQLFEPIDLKKKRVCETLMPPKRLFFFFNVTLIFDLYCDDMTLTSWVLSKATCILNMSMIT